MILNSVCKISEQVHKWIETTNGECPLENICNIFSAYTPIDSIQFIGYNCSPTNPIWGSFRRYEKAQIYGASKIFVDVRYARHLDEATKRFVVVKELCHALEGHEDYHTVSAADVIRLVTELALSSVGASKMSAPTTLEHVAVMGAVEILMPYPKRLEILQRPFDPAKIPEYCDQFGAPPYAVSLAFHPDYMIVAKKIFY